MSTPQQPAPEAVMRGLLFSLVVIPLGIAAWLILWNVGFIASVVAWGIAFLASWLYRLGARRIGRTGVIVVVAVTIVTLALSLVAGFAWDIAAEVQRQYGVPWTVAIGVPEFWQDTFGWMFDPANLLTLILAIAFGFLGCFWTLRQLSRATKTGEQSSSGDIPADGTAPADGTSAAAADEAGSDQEQLPPPAAGPSGA
ncbi:hypothetical protein GCM10022239_07090 [Leifsonia bigeumensis]|uniref:Uncharacterized protein n=1 Tax=Leifsonella bigeumensis TaxID=433643 RepID=A0ABP7FAC3_9MICO